MTPEHAPSRSVALAVATCFVLAFALQAAYAFLLELPVPEVHDEFAYLLSGDTFASGRLTNPTHPHWEHFDTLHVLQHPTYQAKYQPGQGIFLAIGQVVANHPAVGVWLGMAAGCAATTWMLSALLPLLWALLGPLLFLLHVPVLEHWGESYWGGGVALLGGALFLGGLLHLSPEHAHGSPRGLHASLAGLGGFLLVNSRPLEGALLFLLTLPVWVHHIRAWRTAGAGRTAIRSVAVPFAVALCLTLVCMAVYNYAVTHDALRLPYLSWDKYASPREDIQHYAGSSERSFPGKMRYLQRFFSGPTLVFTLPFLLLRGRSRAVQLAALAVVFTGLVSAYTSRAWSHYLAPIAPLTIFLQIEALRGLASIWCGRWIAFCFVGTHILLSVQLHAEVIREGPLDVWYQDRQHVLEQLEELPGKHLCFVRYSPEHSLHREWIYNAADIDAAPVVWANDLGTEENRELIAYYPERSVWIVEPDSETPLPRNYAASDDS